MIKNSNRDDFSKNTIEILCKRVNAICSNPEVNQINLLIQGLHHIFVLLLLVVRDMMQQ